MCAFNCVKLFKFLLFIYLKETVNHVFYKRNIYKIFIISLTSKYCIHGMILVVIFIFHLIITKFIYTLRIC